MEEQNGVQAAAKLNKKQIKYTIILGIIALLLLATCIGYAVYASRLASWEQEVYIQSFSFTLNGNKIGTDNCGTINNEDGTLNLLAKGQEADFVLAVEAKGYATSTFCVPYTITLALDKTQNNELARAVEVYEFKNNEYVFVNMLDKFLNQGTVTLADGSTVSGMTIQGKTGINGAVVYPYKLVYSLGAGEYYEGKGFNIIAQASYTAPEYTNTEYYVYSARDLEDAAAKSTDNVTLVLLKDIELDKNIVFSRKVGLDLNGHTLKMAANTTMTISYENSYTPENPQFYLKITGGSASLISGGTVVINAPNDLILTDDVFEDSSSVQPSAFGQEAFAKYAGYQLSELCKTPVKGTQTTIDFLHGLKKYINPENEKNALSVADTDVVESISAGVCSLNPAVTSANSFTNVYYLQFSSFGTVITGDLTILGNNAYSVAQRVVEKIPEVIHSSVYLPIYDADAKANITWVTTNAELLTNNGVFLENGYEQLPDWTNQMLDIGVIVEVNGERYAAVMTREMCILTAEQRTRLLYDYASMVLDTDDESTAANESVVDIMAHISNADGLRTKLGFNAAKIVVDVATESAANTNYTGKTDNKWYVNYYGDDISLDGAYVGKASLQMLNKPTSIGALVVPSELTFYYKNTSGRAMDYSTERPLLVMGTNKITTMDDPTVSLQVPFTENKYLSGDGTYSFLADGSYNNGNVKVDYEIPADSEWAINDRLEVVNGLYIEANDGEFYRNGEGSFVRFIDGESPATAQRYKRKSLVIVKPENLTMQTSTAHIKAHLIKNDAPSSDVYKNSLYLDPLSVTTTVYQDNWGSTAKDYVLENGKPVEYDLSLVVEGIYHQRSTEIADGNLYALLCRSYDRNGDNYISVSEALLSPINGTTLSYTVPSGGSVDYLNLSSAGISSLKGIEYFVNITGLNLASVTSGTSSNSIIDITYLSSLEKLAYLNMADNSVTDITPLQYLDKLVYINFENADAAAPNNNITDLSAIKYLPNVQYLDLSGNNSLADVEALQNFSSLYYLDVRSLSLTGIFNQYYLTRIYGKNSAHFTSSGTGVYYAYGSDGAYLPSAAVTSAAEALANLTVINETFNTLNLKTEQSLNGHTYSFEWISYSSNIVFTPGYEASAPAPRQTTAYTITSPLVDTPIEIIIYADEGTTSYDMIARRFTFNLLQLSGVQNMSYIEGTDGKIYVSSEKIPDVTLRSLLYEKFNYTGSDTANTYYGENNVYVDVDTGAIVASAGDNTVTIKQSNIITQDEIEYMKANVTGSDILSFGDKKITSLAGISTFSKGITSLDLRGNVLSTGKNGKPDISELAMLNNMSTLYLAGQDYDFTQLARFSETAPTDWAATNIGGGKYGRGLTSLQNLSVYGSYGLDSQSTLEALYQVYLMNKNVSIYKDAAYTGVAETDAANAWRPYEQPLALYLNSLPSTFTYVDLTTSSSYEKTGMYVDQNGVLRLNVEQDESGYYYNLFFYNTLHIKFRISKCNTYTAGGTVSNTNIDTVSSSGYITGFNYKTLVGYSLSQFSQLTLGGSEGADFNADVGRNDNVTGTHYVEQVLEFNHKIRLVVPGDSTPYPLNELLPGRTLLSAIMSSYSSKGLLVSNSTSATTVSYLSGTTDSDGNLVFTLGNNLLHPNAASKPSTHEIEVSGLFLTGGESSIQGLQFTDIATLTMQREAILGTGEWLKNLKALYIGYSAVDLSSLSVEAPNLETFVVGKYYSNQSVKRDCWSVNMYDVSQNNINDTSSDIYKYIVGLDVTNPDVVNDNIYSEGFDVDRSFYAYDSLQKEAVTGSVEAAASYDALRKIARSRNYNGDYNFYLNYFPKLKALNISSTAVYDWTGLLAFMFNSDSSDANYDAVSLDTLNIYSNSTTAWTTFNSNGGISEPIVRKLYQSYLAQNGKAPRYQIGTISDNTKTDSYSPLSFHSQYYTHDVNYGLYDSSRTTEREQSEFGSAVIDLGVKLGDTLHFKHLTQTVTPGTVVYLPATTANVMYGTNSNEIFKRDLPITWEASDGSTISSTVDANGYYEYTTSANSDGTDKYMYFVGTFNGNCYYYPVLTTGTAASTDNMYSSTSYSYGVIEDLQLRLAIYLVMDRAATINPSGITQFVFTPSTTSTVLKTNKLSVDLTKYPTVLSYINGISSVRGFGIFTDMKNLTMSDQYIVDGSGLSTMVNMNELKLDNSLIENLSFVSTMTNATLFSFKDNPIKQTYSEAGTYFPSSTKRVLFFNCGSISATDIEKMSALPLLEEIQIENTLASSSEGTLQALVNIVTNTERANDLAFKAKLTTSGYLPSITKADYSSLTTLMQYLSPDTCPNASFKKLLNSAAGSRFVVGTDSFPSDAGVTFKISNSNIYSNGTWQIASLYSYCDFQMEISFSNYGGYTAYKTVYIDYAGRTATPPLRFYTDSANKQYVEIPYDQIDHNLYMFLVTSAASSGDWAHSIDSNYQYIGFPYKSSRSLSVLSNYGVTSLKGVEKIPNLVNVRMVRNFISDLGFTQVNTTITSLKIENSVSTENGYSSVYFLQALRSIDLTTVTGINYEKPVSGQSTLADLIVGIASPSSMTIKINNEYNYMKTGYGESGIQSDFAFFDSASGKTFGGRPIADFYVGTQNNLSLLIATKWSYGTVLQTYNTRNHNSEVYSNYLWWKNNSYANVFLLNTIAKFGTSSTNETAWSTLLGYLSQKNTTADGLLALPDVINYADYAGIDQSFAAPKYCSVSFKLPQTFSLFSEQYTMNWTVGKLTDPANLNSATTPMDSLLTTDGICYTLGFSSTDNEALSLKDGDKIKITGTAGGGTVTHIFTIYKDAPASYYKKAVEDTSHISTFYIEMETGEIVLANQFFPSGRFLYWLYNNFGNKASSSGLKDAALTTLTGTYTGKYLSLPAGTKYLSYATAQSITKMSINNGPPLGTAPTVGIGSASLEGIQLFANLKELNLLQGYYTSIEPLRNLKLTLFTYSNSNASSYSANVIIQDWTPLYNSRDTLTTFTYSSNSDGAVFNEDFSFLMSFTALKKVSIGNASYNSNVNKIAGFKYMLSWFYLSNPGLETFSFNGVNIYSAGNYLPSALLVQDVNAAQILRQFRATDDCDVDYLNNFELSFRESAVHNANGSVSAKLPSYINHGGKLYPVEWVSMSSFISLSCKDAGGNDVKGGSMVTEDEKYFIPAATGYTWTMSMKDTSADYIGAARIIARIMTDDGVFERVFTFNTFDRKTYPSLTLMSGFASYALPTGKIFTAADGYGQLYTVLSKTLASGKTQSVLVLNPAAVGNEIYVNINGVKTKLEFDVDSAYFTNLNALHTAMLADYARIGSVSTDYTSSNIAVLKQKADAYNGISIGEWIYMQYTYGDDVDAMKAIAKALNQRLNELNAE